MGFPDAWRTRCIRPKVPRPSQQQQHHCRPWLLWVLAISAVFIVWSSLFIGRQSYIAIDDQRYFCLFDDAMISMRYAWNLAHGNGLVWNPGERVEGFTNLLMTLLMAPATLLFDKVHAVLAIQVFGVLVMLAIAWLSLAIAEQVFYAEPAFLPTARVLAFAVSLTYYRLVFFSLMGMETGLLTFLLMAAVLEVLRYEVDHRAFHLVLADAALVLAYLTRNDSLLPAGVLALYAFFLIPRTGRAAKARFWLMAAALYVTAVAGLGIMRYLYYGEWLPNTYTLKLTGMPLSDRLANGFAFISPYIIEVGLIILSIVCDVWLTRCHHSILALAMWGIMLVYQVYIGGDAWPMWRMLAPAMPFLFIILIRAVRNLLPRLNNLFKAGRSAGQRPSAPFWLVIYLLLFAIANTATASEQLLLTPAYLVPLHNGYIDDAVALNAVTTQDATIGVFMAGMLPYYTERRAVDFLGKSDRYIAQLAPDLGSVSYSGMYSVPGHNKYDLDYSIKRLQPTYIQYYAWGKQNVYDWVILHYELVSYRGVSMWLLKDSADVLWDKVTIVNQ